VTEQDVISAYRGPTWSTLLLGIVLALGGLVVLGDVVLATVISAIIIGIVLVISGAFEIFYAVWAGGWRGFIWHTLLGISYIVFGCVLISQPAAGSLILTWIIGAVLLVSGVIRAVLSFRQAGTGGWLVFISGLFGFLGGILILAHWPDSGLWVIGTFLGIDLILHGVSWIVIALRPRSVASR
jgi:uncharacterized membrane protein HdeD (DUF308 family)